MSDYRHFKRHSNTGFDGSTPETAAYVQSGFLWTTPTVTEVGLFSPTALGRKGGTASQVRVFSDSGAVGIATIQTAEGATRSTHNIIAAGTATLLLLPTDNLLVSGADMRDVGILVNDLTEEQLAAVESFPECCDPDAPDNVVTITMDVPGVVPTPGSDLIVNIAFTTGDATLPALLAVPLGRRIRFVRTANDAAPPGPPRIVTSAVGDNVNGRFGATITPFLLQRVGDSVEYRRVEGGWVIDRGESSPIRQVNTAPAGQDGHVYVTLNAAAALALPSLADCGIGYTLEVYNPEHLIVCAITADGADTINDLATYALSGGRAVKLVNTGLQWFAIGEEEWQANISSGATPLNLTAWRGQLSITQSVAGVINLPAAADMWPGGSAIILNASTGEVTLDPAGGDLINGNATRTIPRNHAVYLRYDDGIWFCVGGVFQTAQVTAAADPTNLPVFQDSPLPVESTGGANQVVNLPLAASLQQGATIVAWNSSGNTHVYTAAGGDTINGAGTFNLATTVRAIFTRATSTTWIAVRGA